MSVPNKTNPQFFNALRPYRAVARGMEDFTNLIEKDFFADTKLLFRFSKETKKTELILDINCNFGLTMGLHHFNSGNWGGFKKDVELESSFSNAFNILNKANEQALDLVEVSLNFEDTSIIITQLYDYSIPEALGNIISKISEHFVYFTKGLTAMPNEIFVPVFEDTLPESPGQEKEQNSYFDYWGLYFQEDNQFVPTVYCLKNRKFCNENLFLLE